MFCRLSQIGSTVLTTVGLLAIAGSLVALVPNALANEPVGTVCQFPSAGCSIPGEDCAVGTCDTGYDCSTQCSCVEEDGEDMCHRSPIQP